MNKKISSFFFVKFLMVFVGTLLALRFLLILSEPYMLQSNKWSKDRASGILEAIKEISPTQLNTILFLGPSEVEVGYDSIAFDKESEVRGSKTTSYNFAVRNIGTFIPLYFSAITRALQKNQVRPKVIFVQIPPSRLTVLARTSQKEQSKSHDLTSVFFDYHEFDQPYMSLEDFLYLSFNKYILKEHTLQQLQFQLSRYFKNSFIKDNLIFDIWNSLDLQTDPAYDPLVRGTFYWKFENNKNLELRAYTTEREELYVASIRVQEKCCDFYGLNLDLDYIDQVKQAVLRLTKIADHVVVVSLPEHPSYESDKERDLKLDNIMKEFSDLKNVEYFDFMHDQDFVKNDFIDVIHFSPEGVKKFSQKLANKVPLSWYN